MRRRPPGRERAKRRRGARSPVASSRSPGTVTRSTMIELAPGGLVVIGRSGLRGLVGELARELLHRMLDLLERVLFLLEVLPQPLDGILLVHRFGVADQ